MSLDKLVELGAQVVAGTAYLGGKDVGRFASGHFLITPEGEAAIERAKPQEPQQLDAPRRGPKPKAKPVVEAEAAEPQDSADGA